LERLTYRYLISDSGYSKATLERKFKKYLNTAPIFQIKRNAAANIIIDSTYFKGDLCLMLYYDFDLKYCQMYRFGKKEVFSEIKEDLENLKTLGVSIKSITSDGHPAILKAVRVVYPEVIHQRCLVHIQREANIWLRKKPVNQASIDLKAVVKSISLIQTQNDKTAWLKLFNDWFDRYEPYIKEKAFSETSGRWWYRHKDLRRAAIMIKKAIPNMFYYITYPSIQRSSNSIESFFGHLKDNLSIHRGLTKTNRKAFIHWYLHFKNQTRPKVFLAISMPINEESNQKIDCFHL
jgi:transposase-like protein